MNSAIPVKQDIFELVLDFYRKPSNYPDLLDSLKPLPAGITDLLELTVGEVEARSKILTRAAADEAPSELVDATSYFSEQVLFAPGGDHYRVLGLNHNTNVDNIREHYDLLARLFHQDKDKEAAESDFSRLKRAYGILRDSKKRVEYDRSLETQGRLQQPVKQEESAYVATTPATTNVQPIKSDLAKSKPTKKATQTEKNDSKRLSQRFTEKHSATNSGSLPKILIIDDSATVRAGLSLTLNKEFDCITAKNGEKAWKKLQQMNDIVLVLTDLDMPELNGYDFISRIRSHEDEHIKTLPVIVVTGTEDIDAKQKAINTGADDFLAKSTDYIEVLTRVRVHYRLVETRQQLLASKMQVQSQSAATTNKKSGLDTGFDASERSSYSRTVDSAIEYAEEKTGLKNIITIGSFGIVAVVLISLLYFTQIQPENENDSLAEPKNKISQSDNLGQTAERENAFAGTFADKKTAEIVAKPKALKQSSTPKPKQKQEIKKSKPVVTQLSTQKSKAPAPVTAVKSPTIAELILQEEKRVQQRKAASSVESKSISAQLPITKNVPSVNKISTAPVKSAKPKTTIALAKPAASSFTKKPRITQRELALFIFRFIRSYEDGNLFQFMRLFSENATTEDRSDRFSIEADYRDLFRKSAARRFILGDLDWKYKNNTAKGYGFFEVKIWPKGDDQFKKFTGEVTIEVLKSEKDGLLITGLYHKF